MKVVTRLSAVLQAFREVTDNPVSEGSARIVGQALGVLPIEALLYTLHEAREAVIRAADVAAASASEAVAAGSAGLRAKALHPTPLLVGDVRTNTAYSRSMLIELAAALQALNWAVSPPGEPSPPICY